MSEWDDDEWDACEMMDFSEDEGDDFSEPSKKKSTISKEEAARIRAVKTRERHITRRAMSEASLYEVIDWHLEEGASYHCISGGDVDSLSYLRAIVKQQPLDYCLISTWCMAMTDAKEIGAWVEKGLVKRLDLYIGEIFMQRDPDIYAYFRDEIMPMMGGRVCALRNHAKVMLAIGPRLSVAIASSANVNTNPRLENTTMTVDRDVVDFYKAFFDELHAFNDKDFPGWTPWKE